MPVSTPPCADVLANLYNAIIALQGGKQAVSVSFGERSVSYGQSNLKDMIALYRTHWRLCGAGSSLPDLSPAAQVERGAPFKIYG